MERYCVVAPDIAVRPAGRGAVVGIQIPGEQTPAEPVVPGSVHDPLPEALTLARGALEAGLGLKLLGGLAVRVICPDFPPRLRRDQDIDFVLLSKLQIVELNEKDVRDILQLLGAVPVGDGQSGGRHAAGQARGGPAGSGPVIDTERFAKLLGADWGWWRTVTINLAKLPGLVAERPEIAPPSPPFDPVEQSQRLLQIAKSAPKSVKWKLRANIGDRVRWYELPEEVAH